MRYLDRAYLSLIALSATIVPAFAHRGSNGHRAPEIDASAGIATLAVVATAAVIAYTRTKR